MKKPTISQLKKKLDKIFSIWVRSKSDHCYTCGAKVQGKNKQASHFISRQHQATRWDENNVKVCCYRCNIWLRGNIAEFSARLMKEIGEKEFKNLIQKGRGIKQ